MRTRVAVLLFASVFAMSAAAAAEKPATVTLPISTPNAVILIRTNNLSTCVDKFLEIGAAFEPEEADDMKQAKAELFNELLPGVDKNAPAALLILAPAVLESPDGEDAEPSFAFIFQLQDPTAFAGVQQGRFGPKYRVVRKLGIVSTSTAALDEVAAAIEAAKLDKIPVDDVKDLAVLNTNSAELMKRYKPAIEKAIKDAKTELKNNPEHRDADSPLTAEQIQSMATKSLDNVLGLVNGIEKQGGPVVISANFGAERISGKVQITLASGSDADNFIRKNSKPANLDIANYLPADACLASIKNTDPKSSLNLLGDLVGNALDTLGAPATEIQQIKAAFAEAAPGFTGLSAMAIVPSKGVLGGVHLFGISDAKQAQAALKKIVDTTSKGTAGTILAKYGITIAYTEKARTQNNVPIDKIEIAIDYDKLCKAADGKAPDSSDKDDFGKALEAVFGSRDKITIEAVYGSKIMAAAWGSQYQTLMNAEIERIRARGADNIAKDPLFTAAIARHPKNASAFTIFSLTRASDIFANLEAVDSNPGDILTVPRRSELPAELSMMSLSAASEKNVLTFTVDIPLQPIISFAHKIQEKERKAWEERRKRANPKSDEDDY